LFYGDFFQSLKVNEPQKHEHDVTLYCRGCIVTGLVVSARATFALK